MALGLKIFLAPVFIVSRGVVLTVWGKRNKALAILAALVAVVGSYYLGKSIGEGFESEVVRELDQKNPGAVSGSNENRGASTTIWSPLKTQVCQLCSSSDQLVTTQVGTRFMEAS